MIEVRELSKYYGDVAAVDSISFTGEQGQILGFLGPNGAGKTTTLRMLTGILAPSEGAARVADHPLPGGEEAIKNRIGYMSQRFGLYPDLTVEENLRFYADLYRVPRRTRLEMEERLLGFSNLTPFRRRLARGRPASISSVSANTGLPDRDRFRQSRDPAPA